MALPALIADIVASNEFVRVGGGVVTAVAVPVMVASAPLLDDKGRG